MKIKIAEAPELVINFLVAKCEGVEVVAWQCEDRSAYYVVMADAFTDKAPTTFSESVLRTWLKQIQDLLPES